MQHSPQRALGRYALFDAIAAGGMATVHLGRMLGPAGFAKTVAIKRLHAHLVGDPEFVAMFLDEARLAARIQHPNVVSTLDVVAVEGEVFLVLDYVQGESLSHLLKATRSKCVAMTPRIVAAIMVNVLHGLHAAHEAQDEYGHPLGIVHRDVSPQNIMVGTDGVARVLDFGVAKAAGRLQSTRDGQLKGKLVYMAPEQVRGQPIDARTDVYSAAVVLWEALAGRRLIQDMNEGQVLHAVLTGGFAPPSTVTPGLSAAVDSVVMRGLELDPRARYSTAREMAIAIEDAVGVASPFEVGEWVETVALDALALRAARVREMESTSAVHLIPGVGVSDETTRANAPFRATGEASPHRDEPTYASYPAPSLPHEEVTYASYPAPPPPSEGTFPSYPSAVSSPTHPSAISWPSDSSAVSSPSHPSAGSWPSHPSAALPESAPGAQPFPGHPAPAGQPSQSHVRLVVTVVAITAVVGLAGIAALVAWRTHRRGATAPAALPVASQSRVPPAPAVLDSAVPSLSAEPTVPSSRAAVAPAPALPSVPLPVKTAKSGRSRAVPHASTSTHGSLHATVKSGASKHTKAKSCASPFFVDSQGIKHVRPECM